MQRAKSFQGWRLMALVPLLALFGCLSLKAPESIVIGGREPDAGPARGVPQISTVEEGRVELDKAYRRIQRLEDKNRELASDVSKLKRERDEYKERAERE
jgi:hypothetical protein